MQEEALSSEQVKFSRSVKALVGIVLLTGSLLTALVALEAVVRVLDLDKPKLPSWEDRPKQYFYHEKTSSLQDWSHSIPKPEGTFRIGVVGDSFTFAPYMQADDTFVAKLERLLNLNLQQKKVEVVNYGVPRYSTSHEIATTERAIKEQADLIILQITLNDPEIKPYRPTGLIQSDRFGQPLPQNWFVDNIRTLRFVLQRYENSQSVQRYRDYFFDLWENQKTFGQFQSSLAKINQLSATAQVPLVAVTFPLFGFPNDERYPFHPIHQKVATELSKLQIKNLDLFEYYKDIPLERLVVLPGRDRHPNEIAHRLAAEAILSWIEKEALVPSDVIPKKRSLNREGINFEDNNTEFRLRN